MDEHDVRTAIRLRALQALDYTLLNIGHCFVVALLPAVAPPKMQVNFVLRLQAEARLEATARSAHPE